MFLLQKHFPTVSLPRLFFTALAALFLASCASQQPATSAPVPPQPSTIVIVHGLYANANHVHPLSNTLTAEGFTCLTPTLLPNDGSVSIKELAQQLNDYLARELPADAPIQLVGHSMGGLVALQYIQQHDENMRTRALHSIACPHHGTILANLHGGTGGREMLPGSPLVKELLSTVPHCPVTTYRSPHDLVIIPNNSATLTYADNQIIASTGHNEILSSEELKKNLLLKIRHIEAQ